MNSPILINAPKTKCVRETYNGKQYYVYNVSRDKENYSQRKSNYSYINKEYKANAHTLCNVHMITMGLDYAGYLTKYSNLISKIVTNESRFPDKLARFMHESKEVLDFYKKVSPTEYANFIAGKKDAYGPNEIHKVLSYATNKILDIGNITYFSTNVSWVEILNEIIFKELPVGISGKFNNYNHIVLLVGAAYSKLDDGDKPGLYQAPDFLIQDDPYGKTYEYDKGLSGNDIWIEFNKCVKDYKNVNNEKIKYAHRFIRPEDLG